MLSRRRFIAAGALAFATPALRASAQSRRASPLKITVGGGPGSIPDVVGRLLSARLQEIAERAVIVENRPGAGGIAAMQAMLADKEANTLALATIGQAVFNAYLFKSLPYDPERDVAPVARLVSSSMALAKNASLKPETLRELATMSPSEQANLNFATPPQGSPPHLAAILMVKALNIKATLTPYKTGPDAIAAVRRGEAHLALDGPAVMAAGLSAGELKILAVTGERRLAQLPQTPTVAEAGYDAARFESWMGLLGPASLPQGVIAEMNRTCAAAMANEEFQSKIRGAGFLPAYAGEAEFGTIMRDDRERWSHIIREAGITLG